MTVPETVDVLLRENQIEPIDWSLAALAAELAGEDGPAMALAAALLSKHARAGHSCIELEAEALGRGEWLRLLGESDLVATPNQAAAKPFVLDAGRLYLRRMWRRERFVANRLLELAAPVSDGDPDREDENLRRILDALYGGLAHSRKQRKATEAAATRRLCCVSGGPGTGKTTLVAKIISALVKLGAASIDNLELDIALLAPTGKAAARLREATAQSFNELEDGAVPPETVAAMTGTIHRWLRKTEGDRMLVKTLIVDEVSMVDINLMSRVVEALAPAARLVLIGDAFQLSSVEPGSVFADICAAAGDPNCPLHDCVTELKHNFRFGAQSNIGNLTAAIKNSDFDAVERLLADEDKPEAVLLPLTEDNLTELAGQCVEEYFAPILAKARSAGAEGRTVLEENPFRKFMVLCAHREGKFGSMRFNALVERKLRELGLVAANKKFYPGRPIIVTRNDYDIGLANGDLGIVLDGAGGLGKVWFPERADSRGGAKLVSPMRLPPHDSCYALTVHKAQGSEFDRVAFVPGPPDSPLNSRELLYTAVTRARKQVSIHGSAEALREATGRETLRWSGLKDALL